MKTPKLIIGGMLALWMGLAGGPMAFGQMEPPPGPPGSDAARMRTLNEVQPRMPISRLPYSITNPGSYYLTATLVSTLSVHGIVIHSDDVVVDLSGFTVWGRGHAGTGVLLDGPRRNVLVKNGVIMEWAFGGLNASQSMFCAFADLVATSNSFYGIRAGSYSRVLNCNSYRNTSGCGIGTGIGATLNGCVANFNNGNGFDLGDFSRVQDCQAVGNTQSGFMADSLATLVRCRGYENGLHGAMLGSKCSVLDGFFVGQKTASPGAGIYLLRDKNRIENNYLCDNHTALEAISGSSGNFIIRNQAADNMYGYVLPGGNSYGEIVDVRGGSVISNANAWCNFIY